MMPDLLGSSVDLALVLLPSAVSLLILAGVLILGWKRLTRYSALVPIVVTLMLMAAQRVAPARTRFHLSRAVGLCVFVRVHHIGLSIDGATGTPGSS